MAPQPFAVLWRVYLHFTSQLLLVIDAHLPSLNKRAAHSHIPHTDTNICFSHMAGERTPFYRGGASASGPRLRVGKRLIHSYFSSSLGPAFMKTGCMVSQRSLRLATREDSGGARADSLASFSFLSPTWLMTGLFPGVFLPSGQIAVGSSGAFFL